MGWLPGFGDASATHASTIMSVLKDGLISNFARWRRLSSAAGLGNSGLLALPLTGGPR
jgi:hypothetical protein